MDIGRKVSLADKIEGLEGDDRVEEALKELKSRLGDAPETKAVKAKKSKVKASEKKESNDE